MIVLVSYQNHQAVPVLVRSNQATGQPVDAGQTLEMMFDLQPAEDGVADLILIVEGAVG